MSDLVTLTEMLVRAGYTRIESDPREVPEEQSEQEFSPDDDFPPRFLFSETPHDEIGGPQEPGAVRSISHSVWE